MGYFVVNSMYFISRHSRTCGTSKNRVREVPCSTKNDCSVNHADSDTPVVGNTDNMLTTNEVTTSSPPMYSITEGAGVHQSERSRGRQAQLGWP